MRLVVRTGEGVPGQKVIREIEQLVGDDFYVVDVSAKPGEVESAWLDAARKEMIG